MAFTEDLSAFTADFGVDATLAGQPVRLIFDAPSAQGQFFNGSSAVVTQGVLGMAGTQPMATLPTAQAGATPEGAVLAIGAKSYTVVAHEPDGTGLSRLLLEVLT